MQKKAKKKLSRYCHKGIDLQIMNRVKCRKQASTTSTEVKKAKRVGTH